MYRNAIKELEKWKNKKRRKPLIIRGARQVGKTWLMKHFGESFYEYTIYINFDKNLQMKNLFENNMNTERIIKGIELYSNTKINPENTLLIFDEIQEVPNAISSLKYFYENDPEYHIICAGSLLGIALHNGLSFPVGKIEFLNLYPLSFTEFIMAMGKESYADLITNKDFDMANNFSEEYKELLKKYYFIGGMPEVVSNFIENEDYNEARKIQKEILFGYEQDFSKHAPNKIVPRIRMLWNNIPSQLAKENKKFIYGLIKSGARAKDYEIALSWLLDCGLVYKVNKVKTPNIPLKAYEDLRAFKLFFLDVGLLACMVDIHQSILLNGNHLIKEFKGALTEQFILSQLISSSNLTPYYWTNDRGSAEIDFLISLENKVIPMEVKAEINLKAKSLKAYYEKFKPETSIRCAMTMYKEDDWLINLPLWGIESLNITHI